MPRKISLEEEKARIENMLVYEREKAGKGFKIIGGVDEAGRGPLAGPVVAAVVVLEDEPFYVGLNDSKKLTAKKRDALYDEIMQKAKAVGVGMANEKEIDELNILQATKLAVKRAYEQVREKCEVDCLLLDALHIDGIDVPQETIIKGDAKSLSIAAASVIAKVTRDRMMVEYEGVFPGYGFAKHKGYGTAEHYAGIRELGLCPIHRLTFTKKLH